MPQGPWADDRTGMPPLRPETQTVDLLCIRQRASECWTLLPLPAVLRFESALLHRRRNCKPIPLDISVFPVSNPGGRVQVERSRLTHPRRRAKIRHLTGSSKLQTWTIRLTIACRLCG